MKKIGYMNQNAEIQPFRIAFITLGCKVNQYETDSIQNEFKKLGFLVVHERESADVYIINTCTVTAEADRKSGQMVRRVAKFNENAVVAAMGCSIEIQKENVDAEISVGTQDRISVVQQVINKLSAKFGERFIALDENSLQTKTSSQVTDFQCRLQDTKSRAYIKIEDGCDLFCSYCIIPYARGRVKSRPVEEVIQEANTLLEKGFKEIVLTGIHLCSYGKDLGGGIEMLVDLIESIAELNYSFRIRLGSLEPKSLTEDFIARISKVSKLCPHFHLSLQSGSDFILEQMNRRYTTEQYSETVNLLRKYFPDCGLTTDIITAFPAETKKEHLESLLFCEKMAFSAIHVFPYSERKGTKAEQLLPKVSATEKEKRKKAFLDLAQKLKERYTESWVGQVCEIIFEAKLTGTKTGGYTREYIWVNVAEIEQYCAGQIYRVFIEKKENGELFGKLV